MTDEAWMRRALALAAAQVGKTGENPAVGCVIVAGGVVVGEGMTADGGRPHAEEAALRSAGERARGATAYVTLEPCAHRSSSGIPCTDLLIRSGVASVVIAASDPHPNANGAGIERLRAAGVRITSGVFEAEARAQNAAFIEKWSTR